MADLGPRPAGAVEVAAERRAQALELRKNGASFRQIASALGVDASTAYRDVQAALAETKALSAELAEDVKALELERLDAAVIAISKKVRAGDLGAIDRWLRIMERRAKLLGLDAPTKQDINATVTSHKLEWGDGEDASPPDPAPVAASGAAGCLPLPGTLESP